MDSKKLTIQEFIEKYAEYELKKVKITQMNIEGYGLIEFARPQEGIILSYISGLLKASKLKKDGGMGESTDFRDLIKVSEEFVYSCCPMLQSKEIRDKFSSNEPYEIPTIVFGTGNIVGIAAELSIIFNGGKVNAETEDAIKN